MVTCDTFPCQLLVQRFEIDISVSISSRKNTSYLSQIRDGQAYSLAYREFHLLRPYTGLHSIIMTMIIITENIVLKPFLGIAENLSTYHDAQTKAQERNI